MVALWFEIIFYFLWISIHFRPRTRIANPLPQWALSGITAHSNKGDAKNQTASRDKLPTLSWETIIKKQGILFHANVKQRKCIYLSTRQKTFPVVTSAGCCNVYLRCHAVALYHLRAERKGGKEGRTEQRFSTTTPEEEAESPCSPYTLKSKDPKSYWRLWSLFGPFFLPW